MKQVVIYILLASLILSGCYWNTQVEESEVGLILPDGVSVDRVVGPGRYTDMGYWSDIKIINASAINIIWEDPELVTSDKQPIGLRLSVTYRRNPSAESIGSMWQNYNAEARSDEALNTLVLTRVPRIAKQASATFTLDEMLGISENTESGREVITQLMFDLLSNELDEFGVTLLDVGIDNISPSPAYLKQLEEKAAAQVAVEVSREKTKQLAEQRKQEEAQTEIELEIARRQNLVNEELSQVFEQSPEYYELERLKLLKDILGDNDKLIFLPEGADLTLLFGSESIIPVK